MFVIGVELVMGRMPDARLAWRTGMTSRVLFAITLLLTLTVPLQWAIIAGAVLSLLAFVVSSGSRVDVRRATRDAEGWKPSDDVPAVLPPDQPVVLQYVGPNFFADVAGFTDRLPAPIPRLPGCSSWTWAPWSTSQAPPSRPRQDPGRRSPRATVASC